MQLNGQETTTEDHHIGGPPPRSHLVSHSTMQILTLSVARKTRETRRTERAPRINSYS